MKVTFLFVVLSILIMPALSVMSFKQCQNFGMEFNVLFNVYRYGKIIVVKSASNHLEHIVGLICSEMMYVAVISKSIGCFNCIVKYKLFKTHCIDLYGTFFWDVSNKKQG